MTDELKPCPFCGNTTLHVSKFYYLTGPAHFKVVCQTNGCGAAGPESEPENRAIAKWNQRSNHMTDWIPATRTTAGYYADEQPQRELADLRARIAELEAENNRLRAEHDLYVAGTVNWDSGAVAWTTEPPPFIHSPGYAANEIDAKDLGY